MSIVRSNCRVPPAPGYGLTSESARLCDTTRGGVLVVARTLVLIGSLVVTAPAIGAAESVLADALARATVPNLGVDEHEFVETDLATWLAGPQRAQALARQSTPFADLGASARGDFTTSGSGGSFHLYAESFSDNLTQAYPYAEGLMALHYQAAYIGAREADVVFALPAAGILSAISYSAVAPGDIVASASTSVLVQDCFISPVDGCAHLETVFGYAGEARLSATDFGRPGQLEVSGEWNGDVTRIDDYSVRVSALDFSPPIRVIPLPDFVLIVDYEVTLLTHATRTDFVNHIATADFLGTTQLQFLAFDPVTGAPLGDVLVPIALPSPASVPAPKSATLLSLGFAAALLATACRRARGLDAAGRTSC